MSQDGISSSYPAAAVDPASLAHASAQRHKKLTQAAQELVSQTFFGQMLKQMREDPFKSDLFSGGRGGQMFGSLLDQTLARRMANGSGGRLVRSIVNHLERRGMSGDSRVRREPTDAQRDNPVQPTNANPYRNVRIHVATDLRA